MWLEVKLSLIISKLWFYVEVSKIRNNCWVIYKTNRNHMINYLDRHMSIIRNDPKRLRTASKKINELGGLGSHFKGPHRLAFACPGRRKWSCDG